MTGAAAAADGDVENLELELGNQPVEAFEPALEGLARVALATERVVAGEDVVDVVCEVSRGRPASRYGLSAVKIPRALRLTTAR